jgi:hypothetical protein
MLYRVVAKRMKPNNETNKRAASEKPISAPVVPNGPSDIRIMVVGYDNAVMHGRLIIMLSL